MSGGDGKESAGGSIPVWCGDYPTISGSGCASLFRGGLLDIVAAEKYEVRGKRREEGYLRAIITLGLAMLLKV